MNFQTLMSQKYYANQGQTVLHRTKDFSPQSYKEKKITQFYAFWQNTQTR